MEGTRELAEARILADGLIDHRQIGLSQLPPSFSQIVFDMDPVVTLPEKKLQRLEALGLHLNRPEPAILCRTCGFALTPGGDRVSRHLGEKHGIAKSDRRGLNALIRSLNLPDPRTLPVRPNSSGPHPHLERQRGSACRHCGLRSVSQKVIADYVKAVHSDLLRTAAKLRCYWQRSHIQEGLTFQSWTPKGIRRSWLVAAGEEPSREGTRNDLLPQASPDPIKNLAQQLFAEEHERLQGEPGSPKAPGVNIPTPDLETNWMRRTGWQTTLANARRDILVSLTEIPQRNPDRPFQLGIINGQTLYSPVEDERRLALMMVALDRLLDRCGETVKGTDVCLRRWLRGRFPHQPCRYPCPFELVAMQSSEITYRKELKRCVCFWLRLFRMPLPTATDIRGRALVRSHQKALGELWKDVA